MIRVTFVNFIIFISASDIMDNTIERKINVTLETKNISETALLLDLKTFVRDNGVRRNGSKADLRIPPKYYYPYEHQVKNHIMDLMRQAVYGTQERMLALEPILKKYENDPALRMAFIYNRLRQLIIDLRRVYTVAYYWREKKAPIKRVYEQIYWYSHIVRKYFDVVYIVEHVIDLFNIFVKESNS